MGVMTPEKRMYWLEQQPASIPSVYSTLREDLYVILTSIERDGSATFKIHRNPLVNWIWIGSYVFLVGSLAIMWPQPPRTSGPGSE
jgi:cytochrome c-type biogenesis protein CcmF